jgi:hypothetical protein
VPAENYRASRGPRRVVGYFGMMMQRGVGRSRTGGSCGWGGSAGLLREFRPLWVEVVVNRITMEWKRAFGGASAGVGLGGKWDWPIFRTRLRLPDKKRFPVQ